MELHITDLKYNIYLMDLLAVGYRIRTPRLKSTVLINPLYALGRFMATTQDPPPGASALLL